MLCYPDYLTTLHKAALSPNIPLPDGGDEFPSGPVPPNSTLPDDIIELPSKPINEDDKLKLFSELSSIGDWHSLCMYLGVDGGILSTIEYSDKKVHQKRQDCLVAYINSGRANWKKVVIVVAKPPLNNVNRSCDIAEKYLNIEKKKCIAYLQILK